MHQLERKVRINFSNFNQIIHPKCVGIKFLEQISRLMTKMIRIEYYSNNITISELNFMSCCIRKYYWYYKKMIDNFYD